MTYQKIAITVPPSFLERLDGWARKTGKSRSRFIVDELGKQLKAMEEEEITGLFNAVCSDSDAPDRDRDLAEEMLRTSPIPEEEEEW